MRTARKFASGTVTKKVDCPGCGRSYEYDLSRTVVGRSSKSAATATAAAAQALADANTKLQDALASECDPVCCPACGALTREMKTYRWKNLGAAFAGLGVGIGILLVVYLLMVFLKKVFILAALLGMVCFVLGLAVLAIGVVNMVAPKKGRF
jgi:hypothetical protein